MPDIKAGMTKKIGPLPVWGYGVAVIGGLVGWRLLSGGGSKTELVATPTGAPQDDPSYPSSGAFSALVDRINDLENRGVEQPIPIANPVTPPSLGSSPNLSGRGGGQIQPVAPKPVAIAKPMIARSSKPTAPPPASAPRRVARLPLPTPKPRAVSATKPVSKPVVRKVTTTARKAVSRPVPVAVRKPVAVVRKPAPRRVTPKPAPRPVTVRRPISSVARPI